MERERGEVSSESWGNVVKDKSMENCGTPVESLVVEARDIKTQRDRRRVTMQRRGWSP